MSLKSRGKSLESVGKNQQLGFVSPKLAASIEWLGVDCASRAPRLKIIQINNLVAIDKLLAKDDALKN